MRRQVSLDEAFAAWHASSVPQGEHLAPDVIYELLVSPTERQQHDSYLPHLAQCSVCRVELLEMAQCIEEAAV
ncbi:hypothetical protein C2W62_25360 [Candidatus Entotheonella serta]|nr:hypothetical protein C2W62_25360 [Candidatus Entotheonella serta]